MDAMEVENFNSLVIQLVSWVLSFLFGLYYDDIFILRRRLTDKLEKTGGIIRGLDGVVP
jgi:preprotein translocase subunit SecY